MYFILDDFRLERMLVSNKFRIEKTKRQLEDLYTFRSIYPEMMVFFDVEGTPFLDANQTS